MKVYVERERRTITTTAKSVKELLNELRMNIEEVLVINNGVLVGEEETLNEQDDVRVLSVISGG
jgi:sulfur carrier protein ThiS